MADGTQLGAPVGTGDLIATDDAGAPGKVQIIKLAISADGSATVIPADATVGLRVDPASVSVADGGTLPGKGVQVGGTDGSVFQVLSTDSAGRVNANINGTVPVSIAATQSVNQAQVAGTTTDTNSGNKSAGTQRVVIATDQPQLTNALKVDGSAVTQPVSGTVTSTLSATTNAGATAKTSDYDTGAGTDTVTSFGIALPASGGAVQGGTSTNPVRTDPTGTTTQPISDAGGSLTVDGTVSITANSAVNVAQVAGTATSVNSGTKDAGTQRVILASDQTVVPVSDNAGSLTVDASAASFATNQAQVSGTAVSVNSGTKDAGTQRVTLATDQVQLTNALKVDGSATTQPVSGTVTANLAAAAGAAGLSKFHLVSAGSTNATNVKASAGKLHGWYIYNSNAAARKVAFHNTAGTPTAGASVTDAIVVPPTSAANAFTDTGIAFSTGIAITTVTDLTDAGATAVAANDLVIGLWFI